MIEKLCAESIKEEAEFNVILWVFKKFST